MGTLLNFSDILIMNPPQTNKTNAGLEASAHLDEAGKMFLCRWGRVTASPTHACRRREKHPQALANSRLKFRSTAGGQRNCATTAVALAPWTCEARKPPDNWSQAQNHNRPAHERPAHASPPSRSRRPTACPLLLLVVEGQALQDCATVPATSLTHPLTQ